jgi:hypothetical protein
LPRLSQFIGKLTWNFLPLIFFIQSTHLVPYPILFSNIRAISPRYSKDSYTSHWTPSTDFMSIEKMQSIFITFIVSKIWNLDHSALTPLSWSSARHWPSPSDVSANSRTKLKSLSSICTSADVLLVWCMQTMRTKILLQLQH